MYTLCLNKLFLIFNHTLTKEQIEDAKKSLYVNAFLPLPEALQTAGAPCRLMRDRYKACLETDKGFWHTTAITVICTYSGGFWLLL